MKRLLLFILLSPGIYSFLSAQLSGVKTIGDGGDYVTLTDAVLDVNTNGLNGNAIFEIMDGYDNTEYIHIESYPGNDQYTLTIRPEEGATEVIVRASGGSVLEMDSTNHVIIDGRPGGTANSCALKLVNSNKGNSQAIYTYESKNSIIRDCNIRFDGTRGVCILYADSSIVEQCDIATNTTGPVSNGATIGILNSRSSNTAIRNNRIHNLHVESVNVIYGILIDLYEPTITIDSVYDNFIALNTDAIDSSALVTGIYVTDRENSQSYIYFNSIYLGGDNIQGNNSYALNYEVSGEGVIMNNILINKRSNGSGDGIHYGIKIYKNGAATITSDYNLIVSDGVGGIVGSYTGDGQLDTTLLDWQNHTGWDMNSVSKEVEFQEIENGDLHLTGSSLNDTDLHGIFIPGINNDIDGEERWIDSTFMGADQPSVCIPGTVPDPENIIVNGDFGACTLLPWSLYYADYLGVTANAFLVDGTCIISGITLSANPEPWDVQLNQELSPAQLSMLEKDSTYILTFDASAESGDRPCRISFEQSVDPWANIMNESIMLGVETESYAFEFTLDTIFSDIQLSLQAGSEIPPVTFDNVRLVKKVGGNPTAVDQAGKNTIQLFPNPASEYIMVIAENGAEVKLYNSMGLPVKTQVPVNNRVHFNVIGLPAGIYFVEIAYEHKIYVSKVVIQ